MKERCGGKESLKAVKAGVRTSSEIREFKGTIEDSGISKFQIVLVNGSW